MSIVTGVSTDTEFLEAINSKGATLTNESTAYDLATAIDATGGNVSWDSPNEVVVAAVNAEVPTTEATISYNVHYSTPESENHYFQLIFEDDASSISQSLPATLEKGAKIKSSERIKFSCLASDDFVWDAELTTMTIGDTVYNSAKISEFTGSLSWLRICAKDGGGSAIEDGLPRVLTNDDAMPDGDVVIEIYEAGAGPTE